MKAFILFLITFPLVATALKAGDNLPEFAITSGDLQQAELIAQSGRPLMFQLTLTKEKAFQLGAFTEKNVNRQVVILMNGKFMGSPKVVEKISGNNLSFPLSGDFQKYQEILKGVSEFTPPRAQ